MNKTLRGFYWGGGGINRIGGLQPVKCRFPPHTDIRSSSIMQAPNLDNFEASAVDAVASYSDEESLHDAEDSPHDEECLHDAEGSRHDVDEDVDLDVDVALPDIEAAIAVFEEVEAAPQAEVVDVNEEGAGEEAQAF
mmetsp:Transcript_33799/g.60539  ORF Transcript_33799/g.60539 Transcript_33799/m.60539 type:complete len:137 (-) Transcript_33799:137-547(-)